MRSVQELIKDLIGVDVSTNDLNALQSNPENYCEKEEDVEKIKKLFSVLGGIDEIIDKGDLNESEGN